jgi:hypothetical protein
LLASTTGGLDQSTTHGNRTPTSYICHGCLISSRGVIFPGSHRGRWVEGAGICGNYIKTIYDIFGKLKSSSTWLPSI